MTLYFEQSSPESLVFCNMFIIFTSDVHIDMQHPGELEGWDEADYESEAVEEGGNRMHNGKGSKSKQNLDIEEELYELDYEDLVAGIPTRFKYKQVNPEGFGLSAEDILLADDDDLNKYVSLKKLATYREALDVNAGKLDKKRKRLRVLLRERREQAQLETPQSTKGNKKSGGADHENEDLEDARVDFEGKAAEKRGRKRRKKKSIKLDDQVASTQEKKYKTHTKFSAQNDARQKARVLRSERDLKLNSAKRRAELFR